MDSLPIGIQKSLTLSSSLPLHVPLDIQLEEGKAKGSTEEARDEMAQVKRSDCTNTFLRRIKHVNIKTDVF
jgi:hypothetical protein